MLRRPSATPLRSAGRAASCSACALRDSTLKRAKIRGPARTAFLRGFIGNPGIPNSSAGARGSLGTRATTSPFTRFLNILGA